MCERHPNKLAKTNEEKLLLEEKVKDNEESIRAAEEVMSSTRPRHDISLSLSLDGSNTKSKSTRKSNYKISECFCLFVSRRCCIVDYFISDDSIPYLTEELLYEIIDECEEHNNYSRLIRTLGEVYSDMDSLSRSFLVNEVNSPLDAILDKAGGKFFAT